MNPNIKLYDFNKKRRGRIPHINPLHYSVERSCFVFTKSYVELKENFIDGHNLSTNKFYIIKSVHICTGLFIKNNKLYQFDYFEVMDDNTELINGMLLNGLTTHEIMDFIAL